MLHVTKQQSIQLALHDDVTHHRCPGLVSELLRTSEAARRIAGANESYEESAEREIEEEMGVRNVQLQKCFDFYHTDDISRVWGRLFSCTYDGTFRLDPEEVESGDFMSVKEVKELMSSGKVPPDSTACMEKYLGS
ncbi:TPA: hypothetical protein ACH3X1_005586 [Trebouxia sp. C0004]